MLVLQQTSRTGTSKGTVDPKLIFHLFFFFFLLCTSLSVSQAPPFGKSTCQLIGVINSLPPCPISKKKTPPNTDPSFVLSAVCRKKRGAEAADFIGAQSFQWDSCDEELEAREEGAEEEGRLQLVQWSTFVHQIYGESRPKHRFMHKMPDLWFILASPEEEKCLCAITVFHQ